VNDTPKDFARAKPTTACLSHWQLSRWAIGVASPTDCAMFDAHVATCAHCKLLWQAEQTNHSAAAYAPLPQGLKQLQPDRSRWAIGAPWGYALAATLLVLVAGPAILERMKPAPTIRVKGSEALVVARLRDGAIDEGLWDVLQPMRPGDQVRFKAHTGTASWQGLYIQRKGHWEKLFVGTVAADDWVPTALTVNAGAPSALRLLVCPVTPAAVPEDATVPEGCDRYDANL
jgi:hypothetical protein